jgi:hypothetical protein
MFLGVMELRRSNPIEWQRTGSRFDLLIFRCWAIGGSREWKFSFSLLAPWPRIRERTGGRVKFTQDIRVSLVDVRDSVSIQFFAHKIRKCFAICQFVI